MECLPDIEIDWKYGTAEMNIPDIVYPPLDDRHPIEKEAEMLKTIQEATEAPDQDAESCR